MLFSASGLHNKPSCALLTQIVPLVRRQLPVMMTLVLAQHGWADVGVSGTLEYLGNPERIEDSDSDVMRALSVDANYARETQNFDVIFDYAASKEDYRKDLQFDREFIDGAGIVIWKAIPETLSLRVSNRRSNQLIDAGVAAIPNNEQIVNVNSIGPTLNLQFGAANALTLSADYAQSDYDKSARLDNDRTTLNAAYFHAFSEMLSAQLIFNDTDTEFDGGFSLLDYQLSSLSGSLAYTRSNLTLEAELGEYRIERQSLSQKEPLQRLTGIYQLNSRSNVTVSAGKSVQDLISDPTRWFGFQLDQSGGFGEERPAVGSSEVGSIYIMRSQSVSYNYTNPAAFNFGLTYRDEDRDYQGVDRKEVWESLAASFGVPYGERTNINLQLRYSELDFTQVGGLQERRDASLGVVYRMSNQLTFSFRAYVADQESQSQIDFYNDYDDAGALISASYRFGDW